jgi:SAM-dependent methyltransferase
MSASRMGGPRRRRGRLDLYRLVGTLSSGEMRGGRSMTTTAAGRNKETYNRIWHELTPFIRYNPGARHRRRIMFKLVDDLPKRTVLDVGCGNGELLRLLRARYPEIQKAAGADLSDAVVDQNRQALPDMEFSVLDLEKSALPVQVDLITCTEVVEHLDHREPAFQHLSQMLAPGGALVVTCPTGKVFQTERFFGHTTHPDIPELARLGASAGLVLDRVINWGFPFYRITKWLTNVNPDFALKNFAVEKYGPMQVLVSDALYWANYLNKPSSSHGCQLFALFKKPVAK